MTDGVALEPSIPAKEVILSIASIKALSGISGLGSGALSPLGRVAAPAGPAQRDELVWSLESLDGVSSWLVPALIDPLMTASLVLSDRETVLIGQYAWPDPDARGPGFKISIQGTNLRCTGPLSLHDVKQTFFSFLSLAGVGELGAVRMSLSADQFWVVCALADAYRDSFLRRELARTPGPPVGVSPGQAVAAWQAGLTSPNPGWCVSLFAMMLPAALPADLDRRLPSIMATMAAEGLLTRLEGEGGSLAASFYFFDDGLDDLCRALYRSNTTFGLVVQRKRPPAVEVAMVGGWRTGEGLLMADVGRISEGKVEIVLGGPSVLVDSVETILGPSPPLPDFERFSMESAVSRHAILAALRRPGRGDAETVLMPKDRDAPPREVPTPVASPQSTPVSAACPNCGMPLKRDARFCAECGSRIGSAPVTCRYCGSTVPPGGEFCGECGAPVSRGGGS